MPDYQQQIQKLQDAIGNLDRTSEGYKAQLIALNEQIMELQRLDRESILQPPKFGMEQVDIPASPDDVPQTVTPVTPSPLADKISGQESGKLLKMADDFLAEHKHQSTMDAIQQALEQYKAAEEEKANFKARPDVADILSEKSDVDKAVRESQRTLYGLLARYAQTDVHIIELEGDQEGLVDLDIRNADVLPTGTGFSIKYEMVCDEVELLKWALLWNPTLLQVDMRRAENYVKQLRVFAQGERKSDWYLPLEMPPATIVPRILPTVGDIFAEEDNSDE